MAEPPDLAEAPVVELNGVGMVRSGDVILRDIDWRIEQGQHWVVLGANGSGKTTLARVLSLWEHPSSGVLRVLGGQLGRVDIRDLRRRIGFVSAAMADLIRPELPASDVVMCAINGALEPWWHTYSGADRKAARTALEQAGLGHLCDHRFGTLSSGERQRVLLTRAHLGDPSLVVLDEPNAGLDLGGREQLIDDLDARAREPEAAPIVLVTHHVEEIPPSFTHLLALRAGAVRACGPVAEVLAESLLADCFGVDVALRASRTQYGTRWSVVRA